MPERPAFLDVVALLRDAPEHRLTRGQVGTVVEELSEDVVEVEFSDDDGRPYALQALPRRDLLVLHYAPRPLRPAPTLPSPTLRAGEGEKADTKARAGRIVHVL